MIDINNTKNDRTVCKRCYNKTKRKKIITLLSKIKLEFFYKQPKIENGGNYNNRTLLTGPSCSGETYLILKILSRIPDRVMYIITKSPPEQYSNSKIKTKEISDEIKPSKRIRKRYHSF